VLEDFAQAVGATYRGRSVGSWGKVGAASLMAGKNLPAAGEGGIVVTNDRELRNKAASVKCFSEAVQEDGSYSLIHETLGYNYRINLLSAALASQQLFRLPELNALRRESAARLHAELEDIPGFSPPRQIDGAEHVYHMYRFRFDPAEAGLSVTADQAREGLKQVFWEEGLPLVEFQNAPLPGHPLLKGTVGYGKGCPWSCPGARKIDYRLEDYPGALNAIRSSLVIGFPAQAVLCNPEAVDYYIRCFRKLHENIRSFERFAADLPSQPPWAEPARLF
jgi:perosamine synthetase